MLFGDRLRMLREDNDKTQKELGSAIGVSDRVIGYYESNDRFPKDEEILKKIADYFKVSVDYLLGRTDMHNENDDFIRRIERARSKMPPKEKEKMIKILEASFEDYFDDED